MSLKTLLRILIGRKAEVSLAFSLDGTETVNYHEIDEVMDRLQAAGAVLAISPIKRISPIDSDFPEAPLLKWMYERTDGMTSEQVNEAVDSVVNLMSLLNNGSEMPYHAEGTVKINKAGALLTWNDTEIGFPFQGVTHKMPGDYMQERIASITRDDLRLRLVVDGGTEVASVCTWNVGRSNGQISFSLKEARYWQVDDYGRVLLNQVIEATGKIQRA